MKRIYLSTIFAVVIMINLFTSPVYAGADNMRMVSNEAGERQSILLPPWETESKDVRNSVLRGAILSTAIAEIENEGNGNIGIFIQTLAHRECDQIRHKAYLDRWNEDYQSWEMVDSYAFDETKADYPDEPFTSLTSSFTVLKQPTGYYYRVRGTHAVWLGGESETFSTRTNGILITK